MVAQTQKLIKMNSYTKKEIKDNKLVITQVQEEVLHNIQIEEVAGNAILTHIGAYKRIKFLLNDKTYLSEYGNNLALNEDKSECIVLNHISFDKDIQSNWERYISLPSTKDYWIEAI